MVCGSCAAIEIIPHPVEPFAPASTFRQVFPPSLVLKTPRSSLSFHRCPMAQAYTTLPSLGSIRILAICSESVSPTFFQFSPPSTDLYTPSPIDTLLRSQPSPLPTQTILELEGSMATVPVDCTSGRSKTGLNVVPPLMDFQMPPLADAANTVSRPPSLTAVTAAMRPLISAEPMLRAGRAEIVPESYRTGACPNSGADRRSASMGLFVMFIASCVLRLRLGAAGRSCQ